LYFFCSFRHHNHVVGKLVLPVGVDVRVEYREAVDVADGRWYFPEGFYLFFVGDALLEDCFAFALQSAEHEQHELFQVFYF
jgi:hypothetical protein